MSEQTMTTADAVFGWSDLSVVLSDDAEQDWDALIEDGERAVDEILDAYAAA